ncbi:MAG: A/G-specific adenine glycosylase [Alphaproteobacteria bacterium]|nr:A/G-specific adenine glycosylase [Alphaproteobacteria bacterium]
MSSFSTKILDWYHHAQRKLPWRAKDPIKPNPYHVWLSEIMLQQTTVATVIAYFLNFTEKWPDVKFLANASIDEVLHAWQGLGYYSRAHNLHKTAQIIATDYNGIFPKTEKLLLQLPGIGPYTSAAIMAIAFNQKSLVIDGNVERILARVFRLPFPPKEDMKQLRIVLETLSPNDKFGEFAQSMMDLGATICTPKNPKCDICPVNNFCESYKNLTQHLYPIEKLKAKRPQKFGFVFWVENDKGDIWIRKRENRLLKGLMEIPSTSWEIENWKKEEAIANSPWPEHSWTNVIGQVKHVFTHFELYLNIIKIKKSGLDLEDGFWCAQKDLKDHAFPTLMHKVIKHQLGALNNK